MINWIAIGFLVAIGWFSGKIIFSIIEEILFERLHSSKFANDIYKVETLKDYSNVSTPHDVALQIRIEEIEADKIEDICLGGYME